MTKARAPKSYWTDAEVEILRANNDKPFQEIRALFPYRTRAAVNNKLVQMRCTGRLPAPGGAEKVAGPEILSSPEVPVPLAMVRLAEFDRVVRRAMEDRRAGRTKPSITKGENFIESSFSPKGLAAARKRSPWAGQITAWYGDARRG